MQRSEEKIDRSLVLLNELCLKILSGLSLGDLMRVAQVSKRWREYADNNLWWKMDLVCNGKITHINSREDFIAIFHRPCIRGSKEKFPKLPKFLNQYILNHTSKERLVDVCTFLIVDQAKRYQEAREILQKMPGLVPDPAGYITMCLGLHDPFICTTKILFPPSPEMDLLSVSRTLVLLRESYGEINYSGVRALTKHLLSFEEAYKVHALDGFHAARASYVTPIILDALMRDHDLLALLREKKIPLERIGEISQHQFFAFKDYAREALREGLVSFDEIVALDEDYLIYRHLFSAEGIKALRNEHPFISREALLKMDRHVAFVLLYWKGVELIKEGIVTLKDLIQESGKLGRFAQYPSDYDAGAIIIRLLLKKYIGWKEVCDMWDITPKMYEARLALRMLFCEGAMKFWEEGIIDLAKFKTIYRKGNDSKACLRFLLSSEGFQVHKILTQAAPTLNATTGPSLAATPACMFHQGNSAAVHSAEASSLPSINQG